MDENSYDGWSWAEEWLEENGHIATMLAGGWTLETVEDIPIDEVAEKMGCALWRGKSMPGQDMWQDM